MSECRILSVSYLIDNQQSARQSSSGGPPSRCTARSKLSDGLLMVNHSADALRKMITISRRHDSTQQNKQSNRFEETQINENIIHHKSFQSSLQSKPRRTQQLCAGTHNTRSWNHDKIRKSNSTTTRNGPSMLKIMKYSTIEFRFSTNEWAACWFPDHNPGRAVIILFMSWWRPLTR